MTKKLYTERRLMRKLERGWAIIEGVVNRFVKSDFNPLYHLGTLSIFMLIILIGTGVYLTIIYRPGADVAYATIEKIDSTWIGSLMRSIHRYASDGLILLIILHIVKMFVSDRYWGQRWLAWTSGWIMLAMTWLAGTFGYWLIWDQRAQWMTEFMMQNIAGASGLTYIASNLAARTFSNFVIILFLHVFVPIITFFFINIHSLRLSRARWWTPRWAGIQALVGLIILSVLKPAVSYAPADLSTMVKSVPVDSFYLALLPLTEMWGNVIFWGLAVLVAGSLFLLPWLAPGRDLGPAVITDPKCTGCVLCYAECPYDAIRMVPRDDDSGYQKLAIINPIQCTGCGICVGACPVDAIDLKGGYNGDQTFNAVKGALKRELKDGHAVTVMFASLRAKTLGGLPAELNVSAEKAQIGVTSWDGKEAARVVTAVLPSVGAVNIEWVKQLHAEGARNVLMASHPYDDSMNREDAHWILNRLHLRPSLATEELHWLEVTPGDSHTIRNFLDDLHNGGGQEATILPPVKERNKFVPSIVSAIIGTAIMFGMFALALPLDVSSGMTAADASALRIAVDAKGKIEQPDIPEGFVLPEGADPAKIFGGEHYPMSVLVTVDGLGVLDETYKPSGLSGNGRISALEFIQLEPGQHHVEVMVKDDTDEYRLLFSGEVQFEIGKIWILEYNEKEDVFDLR